MRLVHLWSARAKQAVIMRIPSDTLPRRAAYFSDGTTLGYRSWPPPWPRCAACALLKTRNQLMVSVFHMLTRNEPYRELGANSSDERRRHYTVDRLTARIEHLGYRVHLEPLPTAAA